jgi:hypothetical protein
MTCQHECNFDDTLLQVPKDPTCPEIRPSGFNALGFLESVVLFFVGFCVDFPGFCVIYGLRKICPSICKGPEEFEEEGPSKLSQMPDQIKMQRV